MERKYKLKLTQEQLEQFYDVLQIAEVAMIDSPKVSNRDFDKFVNVKRVITSQIKEVLK